MGSGLFWAWAKDIIRIGDSKADSRRIEAHPLVGGTEYQTRYTCNRQSGEFRLTTRPHAAVPDVKSYWDKDQDEVDLVIETGGGALVGIEVKASATVSASDFKGLRKLAEACGDNFKLGVVLYDGGRPVPFGDRLVAAPMSCSWA
jgi:hypothetical protein